MNSDVLERLERLKESCNDKYERIDALQEVYDKQKEEIEELQRLTPAPTLLAELRLDIANIQLKIAHIMEDHQNELNRRDSLQTSIAERKSVYDEYSTIHMQLRQDIEVKTYELKHHNNTLKEGLYVLRERKEMQNEELRVLSALEAEIERGTGGIAELEWKRRRLHTMSLQRSHTETLLQRLEKEYAQLAAQTRTVSTSSSMATVSRGN